MLPNESGALKFGQKIKSGVQNRKNAPLNRMSSLKMKHAPLWLRGQGGQLPSFPPPSLVRDSDLKNPLSTGKKTLRLI